MIEYLGSSVHLKTKQQDSGERLEMPKESQKTKSQNLIKNSILKSLTSIYFRRSLNIYHARVTTKGWVWLGTIFSESQEESGFVVISVVKKTNFLRSLGLQFWNSKIVYPLILVIKGGKQQKNTVQSCWIFYMKYLFKSFRFKKKQL